MKRVVVASLFLTACASPSTVFEKSPPAPVSSRYVLVDYVAQLFEDVYAPRAFKAEHRGWTLDAELARVRARASSEHDDAAFERGLHLLFRSPADIHTSIGFDDGDAVWLGFAMRRTTSGRRVAWVDPVVRGLPIGAKVIAFDGVPIEDVVARTATETAWDSTPGFRERFADWFAVLRVEREWSEIPKVGTSLRITIEASDGRRDVPIEWREVPSGAVTGCPHWGKSKSSYLTDLGTVTWRGEAEALPAYVFEAHGGRYGYIRMATYGAAGVLADFDRAIDAFIEREVDGVVIDQLGNGGGNYVFALTMLSRLAAEPLIAPTQTFRTDAAGALAAFPDPAIIRPLVDDPGLLLRGPLDYLPRDDETIEALKRFFGFVAAKHPPRALTEPHYQVVDSYRYDDKRGARYLGPIVMLIDELNLSAAEYTAAAFADHAGGPRAVLFGATTSGAGGDQRWYRAERVCGVAKPDGITPCVAPEVAATMRAHHVTGVAMTVTLGYRLETGGSLGPPIENAGVAPHRTYDLTQEDLEKDYAPMKAAIVEALRSARR